MWPTPAEFRQLIKWLQPQLVYLVVRQSRLEQLPPSLRGYSHHANEELMSSISVEVDAATPEVRIFSSENNAVRYISSQQSDSARPVYGFIAAPPHLITGRLMETKADRLWVDLGFVNELKVSRDNFATLNRLARVVQVVKGKFLHIAETKNRSALTVEIQGKKFAVGYRSRDLTDEQERKLAEVSLHTTLVRNSAKKVAVGLLSSDLAGLIVDYGARQQIWQAEELR